MKKKMLLSLVLIVLVSLMLCKVQAAEEDGATTPTITDTPTATEVPEPSTTPDPEPSATPDPEPEDNSTDFSKAEISMIKESNLYTYVQVKNVILKENHSYYVKIGASKQIDITSRNSDAVLDQKEDGTCRTSSAINKYMELNQDLYVSILETYIENAETKTKVVVDGEKLERISQPKYADAFFATFMSHDGTQIVTNFDHDKDSQRKMQIKVGKVTDINILKKIQNKDANGFPELLSYARKTQGIFDQTVNASEDNRIAYSSYKNNNSVLNVKGLTDDAYYFLYVKPDDENGKYYSTEAVTLAQASVYPDQNNAWYLFFYGDNDFEWTDWGDADGEENDDKKDEGRKDDTIAPDKMIPQTGEKSFITLAVLLVMFIGGVLTYVGYRKNNYK